MDPSLSGQFPRVATSLSLSRSPSSNSKLCFSLPTKNSFTRLTVPPTEWLKLVAKLQKLVLLRPAAARAALGGFAKLVDVLLEEATTI